MTTSWLQSPVTIRSFATLSAERHILPATSGVFRIMTLEFTNKYRLATALLALVALFPQPVLADGNVLKGNIQTQDYLKMQGGPSLSRDDINKAGDPFDNGSSGGNGPAESFDAPDEAFKVQSATPAPPPAPKNFDLNAQQGGNGFQGQAMPGMSNQVPVQMQPPQQATNQFVPAQQGNLNDPDAANPAMQLAWDAWHKRVAQEIYMRFNALAQRAFQRSKPLACQVAYTVTKDGQITNIRILRKSSNLIFNSMMFMVLKSMNGNPVLCFPPGSSRSFVEKGGTFSWNYGVQGFKYTTGDREQIQH